MTGFLIVLAVFVPLLSIYAAVRWFTGSEGPCEHMRWWDGENGS